MERQGILLRSTASADRELLLRRCAASAGRKLLRQRYFLQQTVENTFTLSGMVFQDAWNLDLERLQRCYICEVDSAYGMVPFCAYNLTNVDGKALYRR